MMRLRFWEKANLLALVALVGIPTLTLIELIIIRSLNPWLPIINALVFFIIWRCFIEAQKLSPRRLQFKKLLTHPLFWVFALQLIMVIILFSAYLALPDVDPYYWIKVYNQEFTHGSLDQLPQRPLFHTLVYILNQTLHIPSFIVFKNIIPLLSLTTLLPAWLVARRFPGQLKQITLLLIPSLSPSLILHTQIGTPQALLIILTVFFVFLLTYAHLTHQKIWHYLAGIIMAVATFYHGLALLIFAAWLIATAWHSRHRLLGFILLLLIFFATTPYLAIYLPQIINDIRPNLSFPSSFTTVDGVPNGWPGFFGLVQYYAFYLGLVVPVILATNVYLCFKHPAYRRQVYQLATSSSALTLAIMFTIFFSIAEIMPRLFNIALLPDRAWLFGSLAAIVFLIPLLNFAAIKRQMLYGFLMFSFVINISGALYVNNLKQHLIPDYTVKSARWINEHLPAGATVLLNRKPEYIDLYASAHFITLPPDFYCRQPEVPNGETSPAYLLFLKSDPRNPYARRPWQEPLDTPCDQPSLNDYPERFHQIYNDANKAIIWEVL